MSKIKTLVLGFGENSNGQPFMVVGTKAKGSKVEGIKLFEGDSVLTVYKELTDEELVFEEDLSPEQKALLEHAQRTLFKKERKDDTD